MVSQEANDPSVKINRGGLKIINMHHEKGCAIKHCKRVELRKFFRPKTMTGRKKQTKTVKRFYKAYDHLIKDEG